MSSNNIYIRKAIQADLDAVMQIIKSCTEDMISKKIYQWNDKYPNRETFFNDIENEDLLLLVEGNQLLGCVSVTNKMDDFYSTIDWIATTQKNIYVHRLAIHPKYQGLGYAKRIMKHIENDAIENNSDSIRLDTFRMIKKNTNYYSNIGYQKLGKIYFSDQSDMPFNCYEKSLK